MDPVYSCHYDGCDATRGSHQAMKDHVDSVHLKTKKYSCEDCDYKCALKQCLISHMRGIHGKGRPLMQCPFDGCHVKRLSKSAIQLHVDSVHLKIKKHFCHLCEYKSCDSNSLNIHLRGVHNYGGKYQCSFPECKTKCVTKAALQNHVNNKHLKMHSYHTCSVCEFTTYSIREYRRHICSMKVEEIAQKQGLATLQPHHSIFDTTTKSKRGRKPKTPLDYSLQTVNLAPLQLMTLKPEMFQLPAASTSSWGSQNSDNINSG